ncbi:MAG: hypothetical protein I3J00_06725 [Mesosutterella multiformis]|nr:hypothetical protein [Mesosutterella multiformis]
MPPIECVLADFSADIIKELARPLVRPIPAAGIAASPRLLELYELRVRLLTPRKGEKDKAQRIRETGRQLARQR